MIKVAVLGAGAWGTALAKLLADKQHPTTIWSHRADLVAQINEGHVNARYLPSAELPSNLVATADIEEALRGAELVVTVVPSHALRGVMREARPFMPANALICGATKGIERARADSIGMLATVMNALALEAAIEAEGYPARALSAVPMPSVCQPFSRQAALHHLSKGRICVLAGGTGNPFFTTDTGAVLRAAEAGGI